MPLFQNDDFLSLPMIKRRIKMLSKVPAHILITTGLFTLISVGVGLIYVWVPEFINLDIIKELFSKSAISYLIVIVTGSFLKKIIDALDMQREA